MYVLHIEKFNKDLKKLHKKYPSILNDFEILKQVIIDNPTGKDASKHWNEISGISDKSENVSFYKVRMVCRSVQGSDFRVVYMYEHGKIELLFIEMYFKGNKAKEDRKRIQEIIEDLS